MYTLDNEFVEALIAEAAARGYVNPSDVELVEAARDFTPKFGEGRAETLLRSVKRDSRKGLKWSQRRREGFEKRLGKLWAEPIHLLDCWSS